jgi:hypothetical protein
MSDKQDFGNLMAQDSDSEALTLLMFRINSLIQERDEVTEQRDRLAEALDVCLREMLEVIYACNEEIVDVNDTFHQAIKLGQKTLAAVEGGSDE